MKDIMHALELIQPICLKNSFSFGANAHQAESNEVLLIKKYTEVPVISMGIIHWIRHNMQDAEYFSTLNTQYISLHLQLLKLITFNQPLHRPFVLDTLAKMLESIILHHFNASSKSSNLSSLLPFTYSSVTSQSELSLLDSKSSDNLGSMSVNSSLMGTASVGSLSGTLSPVISNASSSSVSSNPASESTNLSSPFALDTLSTVCTSFN